MEFKWSEGDLMPEEPEKTEEDEDDPEVVKHLDCVFEMIPKFMLFTVDINYDYDIELVFISVISKSYLSNLIAT